MQYPSRRQHPAPRRHRRAEAVLIEGCRRGGEDALDALVYRVSDLAWQAASRVYEDPAEARSASIRGLRAALTALRCWHPPSLSALERRVVAAAGRADAGRAPQLAAEDRPAPPDLVDELRKVARSAVPELREAAELRSFWRLQAYAVLLALVAGLVMLLVGFGTVGRLQHVPPALVEGLQFRVRHAALSEALRDAAWDLPDARTTNRVVAARLEEAALALDEIANLSRSEDVENLRYVAWRVGRRDLARLLNDASGMTASRSPQVMDAALALEEVANWFGVD